MKIINERPPNFDLILSAFPNASSPGVIFAFDENVYNPSGNEIPPALIAHENVHLERQRALDPRPGATTQWSGADLWWARYIRDSEFRYHEELLAHAAEFRAQKASDRNISARLLMSTALRLIAPLYQYQPPRNLQQALRDLRREIDHV